MRTRHRILGVDDNSTNLAVIDESLQGRFTLCLVDNSTEALRVAPTFHPDVVLLDAMMPRPDGFEVCSKLKNDPTLRHCYIIMVSARTALEDRLRGYQAGADDYVCRPFDEKELLAKVSAALNTMHMYRTVEAELNAMCDTAGDVLELITHLRDNDTGEHIDRIRVYSHLLALELRTTPLGGAIDDVFLDQLHRASALHDVGKLAIPDSILCKPGPLTDSEREQMQRHTVIGEQILVTLGARNFSPFLKMAAEVARWHHERFDGSGYPDGLPGDAIPLAARIVKVADVFDALTSPRVYKPRIDPHRAKELILRGYGTEFDPAVVDAMLAVFDDFVAACNSDGFCPRQFSRPI